MFLFDADKAANGGIFHELWAIVRNFAMTSGLRLAAAIIVLLLGLKIAKAVLKRYEKSRAFQKIVPDVRGVVRWLAGFLLYALIIVLVIGNPSRLGCNNNQLCRNRSRPCIAGQPFQPCGRNRDSCVQTLPCR